MAVASQSLILRGPSSVVSAKTIACTFSSFPNSYKPNFYKPHHFKLSCKNFSKPYLLACSSNINPSSIPLTESTDHALTDSTRPIPVNTTRQYPTESTRTVSILVATVILISKLFGHAISNYVPGVWNIQCYQENMISTTRPLFFAAMKIYRQQLHTPWTIMASGLAKCIEVYMAVLAIRCALPFFPNIEWNRQPYSSLREMCDPFLLFFQSIVPPVSDSLDISASVGFMVLTVLVEILTARHF